MSDDVKTAAIAAASALIGTAVGSIVAVWVANTQINANRQQALDTFLLSQRQVAFAAFLTDAGDFFADQYSYNPNSSSSENGPANLASMIVSAVNKLDTDNSAVALLGPSNISVLTQELSTVANLIAFKEGLIPTTTPQPEASTVQDLVNMFDADLNQLRQSASNVIKKG
jgi:hypothetical protein